MGKQKRQRQSAHKQNPTGLMSVKDFNEIEDVDGEKEQALHDVYEAVQSYVAEEKLSALQTLETMALDSFVAQQIARDEIAKVVGPLLLDNNPIIRTAAVNTLKQISDSGGITAQLNLVKDDLVTPLMELFKQYYLNWTFKKDYKYAANEKQIYVQSVSLLMMLSEHNIHIIQIINEQNMVSMLTRYLDIDTYDTTIVSITLDCLMSITEDNGPAIKIIKGSEEVLCHIASTMTVEDAKSNPEVWHLKICSIALLESICTKNELYRPTYFNTFIKTLDEVFSIDNKEILSCLVSILPHEQNAASNSKKKKIEEIKILLNTQQIAFETLANFFTSSDDEDMDEDVDSDDSAEMDVDSCGMEVNGMAPVQPLPVQLTEALNHCKLVSKIWEKTIAVNNGDQEILSQTPEGQYILKQFYTLRCRAFICLSNMLLSCDIDVLGGPEDLCSKWLEIGKLVIEKISLEDTELLEATTCALRNIIKQLNDVRTDVFKHLNQDNLQMLMKSDIHTRYTDVSVRVNMIRTLGILALNLTFHLNPHTYHVAKKISEIILEACLTETHIWVLAEALDIIMDIFAEDETDYLAADIYLINKLERLIPMFQKNMERQKSKVKKHYPVVTTVNANLRRFMKYKAKQIRKLTT